jgi:hypothetical protein
MRKILALVAMCLMLTSCMQADMNLTISSDDKVNGQLTIAFEEAALAQSKVTAKQLLENENLFGNSDGTGLATTDFNQDGLVGKTYTFNDMPLNQLARAFGNDGKSLSIIRKGDQILTTGVMDLTQGLDGLDEKSLAMLKSLSSTIVITYPGTIVSTKGQQDGNTVTWVTKLGEKSDFTTVVDSTFEIPAKLGTPTNSSTSNGIVFGALALVAVLVGLTLVRRKKAAAPEVTPEA